MFEPLYNSKMYYVSHLKSYLYVGLYDYVQIQASSMEDIPDADDILESFGLAPAKDTGIILHNTHELKYALKHFY